MVFPIDRAVSGWQIGNMIYGTHRWTDALSQISNDLPNAFLFMARPEGEGKGFLLVATACFIMRKMSESKALSHHNLLGLNIKARSYYPLHYLSLDIQGDDRYDFSAPKSETISVKSLCNQIIHSERYGQNLEFNSSGRRACFRFSGGYELSRKGKIYEIDVNDFIYLLKKFISIPSPPSIDKPHSFSRRKRRIRISALCWSHLYPLRKSISKVNDMYFNSACAERRNSKSTGLRPEW